MYNLDVANLDNFYVGEQGWLVHNGDGYTGPVIVHSAGATDLVTKGVHITVNGIELSVLPDHLGGLTFKPVFSSDSARQVQKAIQTAQSEIQSSVVLRNKLYTNAVEATHNLTTVTGKLADRAVSRSMETNFVAAAIRNMGLCK